MEKLILIDGNSLLNRAFYAMQMFTTKDGQPTNGIFGFMKLIFKIIQDEAPQYFAVTFDLHAPTFRHKMYADYKGTRKGMPEELASQVDILKDALRAMKIRIVEKEGYEADDLLGTLSRAFPNVKTLIYTGDRDSYQLVGENVEICFTRHGVTDIERLTQENFKEKTGITPAQVIEKKALMGDSSDNIPGVKGIGPKCADELIEKYQTLDGVYAHLDEIAPRYQSKLAENKEIAYLSRTLATIDCAVPISVALEDCRLTLPFPEQAREKFAKLEFRTLTDSELFGAHLKTVSAVPTVTCSSADDFLTECAGETEFALAFKETDIHIATRKKEFIFPEKQDLFTTGFFIEELAPVLRFLFQENKTVYAADYKELLHRFGAIVPDVRCRIRDVALLNYLIDSNRRAVKADELAKEYNLTEENCAYALFAADERMQGAIKGTAEETLYAELELPLVSVLFDMEETGVKVDTAKFPELAEKYKTELDALSRKIYALGGVESVNLNSPFQLSDLLFKKLGYSPKGAKKNQRGGYSTSVEVLEQLAEEHEIVRLILRYREIQKLHSTYIDGIRPLIRGDVVHTTYNQMATTTGRLSSANPNLQNIPVRREEGRELRKLFIAREGNLLVDADYSQIELRLLAHFSGSKPLIEAYNGNADIHATTAAQVFGVPIESVTPLMRRRAKTVNFGIIYGMSAFGLAKDLNCSNSEAQEYIDKYFRTYSDVKEYMDENVRRAKNDGYVTTILGRKRYITELKSPNYMTRQFGERAAMNMPLQGSAADIMKLAMLAVHQRLKKENLRAKLVLQVHDELVIDTPSDETETVCALLKEEMENAIRLSVPLIAEVSTGKSWYDAK